VNTNKNRLSEITRHSPQPQHPIQQRYQPSNDRLTQQPKDPILSSDFNINTLKENLKHINQNKNLNKKPLRPAQTPVNFSSNINMLNTQNFKHFNVKVKHKESSSNKDTKKDTNKDINKDTNKEKTIVTHSNKDKLTNPIIMHSNLKDFKSIVTSSHGKNKLTTLITDFGKRKIITKNK